MSYEPTNWKTGDVVTSAKLNKLEQGVAGAGGGDFVKVDVAIENIDGQFVPSLSKTFDEIASAMLSDKIVYLYFSGSLFWPADGYAEGSNTILFSTVPGIYANGNTYKSNVDQIIVYEDNTTEIGQYSNIVEKQ